jgi:hypothetical protein
VNCTNLVKDGTETDVDCGGACARKCDINQGCLVAADCASNICTAGTCRSPWRIQYRAQATAATTQQLQPFFQIVSSGGTSAPLTEFKIRYWYTAEDTTKTQRFDCDYALVGNTNITGAFVAVSPARTNANEYMEVGFTAAAGTLVAGASTGEIQSRIHADTFPNYTQGNDYSFDATKTAYADWDRVTLYHNGVLVWGVEPP